VGVGATQWRAWDRPAGIPSRPDLTYAHEGWVSWNDWLGRKAGGGSWRPFEEAREAVREQNFSSWAEVRTSMCCESND
jgi:hypothetical protein